MLSLLDFERLTLDDGKGCKKSRLYCGLWGLFVELGIMPDNETIIKINRQLDAGGAVYLKGYKITKEFD